MRPRAAGTTRPTTSQAAEHGGTHLDAPIHFSAGGDTAEEVPLRKVVGAAVNVDVRATGRTRTAII